MQFGEALHGVATGCGWVGGGGGDRGQPQAADQFGPRTGCPTSYPAAIAEGATFNRSLWAAVGAAIGREARALHNQPSCAGQANCVNISGALSGKGLAGLAVWAPVTNWPFIC
jgi:beta-glucosidase-like glycosyl hydrolase